MRFLFVHQNFPAQFRHAVNFLAADPRHKVVGICDARNMERAKAVHRNVTIAGYRLREARTGAPHPFLRETQDHVVRGQHALATARRLKEQGFVPDVVVAHPGWGEGLFLRELFPQARHIHYCEYFYHASGTDMGFDPEFAAKPEDGQRITVKNATQLMSLSQCDAGIAPTRWQHALYPPEWRDRITVLHEGIDSALVKPDPAAQLDLGDTLLRAGDDVVTFVARNLEPYRGFHTLMRSLAELQALRPGVHVVIVGGDGVSYGSQPPPGTSYRTLYTQAADRQDAGPVDWSRVHFLGTVPYACYLKVLQVSAAHVYLTYPFVLSWSMLEAMAAGCLVIGSDTAPVREFVRDGENGLLTDFFDPSALAARVAGVLARPADHAPLRTAARRFIVEHLDLASRCLPAWIDFLIQPPPALTAAAPAAHDALAPPAAGAHQQYQFGLGLHRAGRLDQALQVYEQVLRIDPHHTSALGDRGNVRRDLGDLAGAESDFRQVLAFHPGHPMAAHSLGRLLRIAGRLAEAAALLRGVVAARSTPSAHWDLAFTLLQMGEYAEAWPHFDQRHEALGLRQPHVSTVRWDGAVVSGQTLLVLDEQGLGDTLQFLRFLERIPKGEGGRVIFAGKPATLPVVRRILPPEDVYDWNEALPAFQAWVPLMSLAGKLGVERPQQLPAPLARQLATAQQAARWRDSVRGQDGLPVVALCWQGNPQFKDDAMRSPGLAPLLPLLDIGAIRFISLQVGPARSDIAALGQAGRLHDVGGDIEHAGAGLLDTLAALGHCDFVISSCTSVAHLAGLAERPGRIMLSARPDWRWMLGRNDTPWYPSLRLARQRTLGDWGPVVDEIAADLRAWRVAHGAGSEGA